MNTEREQFMAYMSMVINRTVKHHIGEMNRAKHFQSRSNGQKRRWAKQRNQENKQ